MRAAKSACLRCGGPVTRQRKICWECRYGSVGAIERLLSMVTESEATGCWIWTGTRGTGGYGRMGYQRHCQQAHRVSYQVFIGPIPDGLEIDHLCRTPECVNPGHLEAVTKTENNRRRSEAQTHCKRGHEFNEANTRLSNAGSRQCRRCDSMRQRAYVKRKQARLAAAKEPAA